MVLVPVGESAVSISINGTERVNDLIKDDTSYNLSESFNTNIQVNGQNQGSFNQSENSSYNINVSDKRSFNLRRLFEITGRAGPGDDESGTFPESGWVKIKLTAGYNASASLHVRGNQIFSVNNSQGSRMVGVSQGDSWEVFGNEGGSSGDIWEMFVDIVTNETTVQDPKGNNIRVPTGVNVNSVNKS